MADIECGGLYVNFTGFSAEEVTAWYFNNEASLTMGFVVLPIIAVVGILVNLSFIFTFLRTMWMRKQMYVYLLHLALVDICILLLGSSQRLITNLLSPFNFAEEAFGGAACVASLFIEALYYASLIIVTSISMERYFAICHPLRHMASGAKRRTIVVFISTWAFSLAVAILQIPQKFANRVFCVVYPDDDAFNEFPTTVRRCMPLVEGFDVYYSVLQLVVFYTCLVFNIFCYVNIMTSMSRRSKVTKKGSASGEQLKQARKSTTRMILVNGSVYFLCNSPAQFFLTLELVYRLSGNLLPISDGVADGLFRAFQILLYVNSAINAVIYSATNAKYRAAMVTAFKFWVDEKPSTSIRSSKSENLATSQVSSV